MRRSQDPDTGVVHRDDRIEALRHTQSEHVDLPRRRDRISIHRHDFELVTG